MSTTETAIGTPFPVAKQCPTPRQVLEGASIDNPGGDMRIEPICIAAMRLEADGSLHFSQDAVTVHLMGGQNGAMRVMRDVSGVYARPGHENTLILY